MAVATLLADALDERGNAVMVIARPQDGEHAVIKSANAVVSRMIGCPAQALDGTRLGSLRHLVDSASDWASLIAAVSTLTPLQQDMKIKGSDHESWLGFGLTFKTDSGDGAAYGILIGRDITQARRRTLQDNESQRLLASVFLRTSAAVMIVRLGGAILMANAAAQRLLGYGAEELLGLNVQTLTRGDFAEQAAAARDKQLSDGVTYEIAIETLTKSGASIRIRLTSVLLANLEHQGLRIVTLLPDCTACPCVLAPSDVLACSIGQLQAIHPVAFKAAFGDGWERSAARAMMQAERILTRRLAIGDVFNRLDDHGFIIWFEGADGERNTAVLTAAARELRLKLLADFDPDLATGVSAAVVGESISDDGEVRRLDTAGRLVLTRALLDRLQDQRHVASLKAKGDWSRNYAQRSRQMSRW